MRTGRLRWLTHLLMDIALIDLGWVIAFQLRYLHHVPQVNFTPFLTALPYITLLTVILLWAYEPYLYGWNRLGDSIVSIILATSILTFGTMALTYWLRGFAFPRTVFLLAPPIQSALLIGWRWLYLKLKLKSGRSLKVVVIGEDNPAAFLRRINEAYTGPVNAVGAFADGRDLPQVIAAMAEADAAYFAVADPYEGRDEIMSWCLAHDKTVFVVPNAYSIMLHGAVKTHLGDQPLFRIAELGLRPTQQLLKRMEDLALGLILALVTLPVFPFIMAAIKASSSGPVFYRQERLGLGGRRFFIYKFRTMIDGAEKQTGPVLATEHDPRITPVGRCLRATRLDELPQVLNILKGEMSFVGPRPERPEFTARFTREIPAYQYRLKVKPGVTGLAQVRGNYDTAVEDKLRFDLYYIRNWSLLLDLRILFQTVWVVLKPGAARGVASPASPGKGRTAMVPSSQS